MSYFVEWWVYWLLHNCITAVKRKRKYVTERQNWCASKMSFFVDACIIRSIGILPKALYFSAFPALLLLLLRICILLGIRHFNRQFKKQYNCTNFLARHSPIELPSILDIPGTWYVQLHIVVNCNRNSSWTWKAKCLAGQERNHKSQITNHESQITNAHWWWRYRCIFKYLIDTEKIKNERSCET